MLFSLLLFFHLSRVPEKYPQMPGPARDLQQLFPPLLFI
jgi:hypothetical protein